MIMLSGEPKPGKTAVLSPIDAYVAEWGWRTATTGTASRLQHFPKGSLLAELGELRVGAAGQFGIVLALDGLPWADAAWAWLVAALIRQPRWAPAGGPERQGPLLVLLPHAPISATAHISATAATLHGPPGIAALHGPPGIATCGPEVVAATFKAATFKAVAPAGVPCQVNEAPRFCHLLVPAAYWLPRPDPRAAACRQAAGYLAPADGHVETRALYRAEPEPPGDADAADVLRAAARSTLSSDPANAARWIRAWLRITGPGPSAGGTGSGADDLRLLLAEALWLAGEPGEAGTVLRAMLGTGSRRTQAQVLLARCERALGRYTTVRKLLTSEFTSQGRSETAAAAELELARADLVLGFRAASVARLTGRSAEPAGAALLALAGLNDAIGPAQRSAVHRAARLLDGLTDSELRDVLDTVPAAGWAERHLGLLDTALARLDRALEVAHRHWHLSAVPELLLVRSAIAADQGRLTDAIQDADEVAECARRLGYADQMVIAGALKMRPLLWQHGPAPVRQLLASLPAIAVPRGLWPGTLAAAAQGEALLQLGEPASARHLIDSALKLTEADPDPHRPSLLALAAVAALDCGDLPAATTLSKRASEAARSTGLDVELGNAAMASARVEIGRGAVEAAARSADLAIDALQRVPVLAGQARLLAGDVAMVAGDHDEAGRQLALAKQTFNATGARWLATMATNAQRRLGARRSRGRAARDQISRREREIAELICQGLSNKAIAERLVLSVRTVESHVASLFVKLGVTSRLAVARTLLIGPQR
jgi:DNA-binding CsgD family transcriptional regulator/tetratricopeptide (TPR) repeat protein